MAARLQVRCLELGLTLATAESCTGGLIGDLLTEVPGASDYYLGGVISYSDSVKERQLGVDADTLAAHGAVSAETALAMAHGVRARFGASIGVAVTGIAGPAGGTAAKPVGLTYVCVADERGDAVRRHVWHGDRSDNKLHSARAALQLLLERIDAPDAGD
jgi:nicotinamide-nucleotide amidase